MRICSSSNMQTRRSGIVLGLRVDLGQLGPFVSSSSAVIVGHQL